MSINSSEATLRAFLRGAAGAEPAELVGAPLRLSLGRVRERIDAAESQLVDLVTASHSDIDTTLALGEQVACELVALRAGLSAVPHNELQRRVHSAIASRGRIHDELASARSVRDTLQSLAEMHGALSRFDAALEQSDLCEGSEALHGMTSQLDELRSSGRVAVEGRLLELLAKKTDGSRAKLSDAASSAWHAVVRITCAGGEGVGGAAELRLVGTGAGGSVDPSIVTALRRTHGLDASLNQLAADICTKLLPSLALSAGARLRLSREEAPPPAWDGPRAASGTCWVLQVVRVEESSSSAADALVVAPRHEAPASADGSVSAHRLVAHVERACEGLAELARALRGFFLGREGGVASGEEASGGGEDDGAGLVRFVGGALWEGLRTTLLDGVLFPALEAEMERGLAQMRVAEVEAEAGLAAEGVGAGSAAPCVVALAGGVDAVDAAALARRRRASGADAAAAMARGVREAAAAVRRLESTLVAAGVSRHDVPSLADSAAAAQRLVATRLADQLLGDARRALLATAAGSQLVGESPLISSANGVSQTDELVESLQLQRCRASERAVQLLALCRRALDAAVLSDEAGAAVLVRRARELIELFVAVAPTRVPQPMVSFVVTCLRISRRSLHTLSSAFFFPFCTSFAIYNSHHKS